MARKQPVAPRASAQMAQTSMLLQGIALVADMPPSLFAADGPETTTAKRSLAACGRLGLIGESSIFTEFPKRIMRMVTLGGCPSRRPPEKASTRQGLPDGKVNPDAGDPQ